MADWRNFDASNEPETCLWCGRKLRHKTTKHHYEVVEVPIKRTDVDYQYQVEEGYTVRKKHKLVVDERAEKGGDYQDGQFCGLRCGMQFAWRLADLGRRLNPKEVK
jgi:hypothetical protein